ncbi:hypothetical protein HXX76_009334 [Chlamydomonas incerta]|uniref:VASt domain-containing protein n=1 Tax=Chlamydomonas incerta TaxID=51695 RepID=A0A835T599_CHLIN|nr:hypothetical protein HXX76_009334 [Chlamydomonas incerta]|eukprot:KAG2431841.1 hypothetical protein HXX76_009334 [Chlamydomonas incerta]
MGRAPTLATLWPADGDPKTLLCVRVPCSADELFKTVFVDPELQVQLHKQRNDNALVETLWVPSRDQLPPELYTWPGPPAGERNEPGATLRYRKVRFESPPTALASKPFQNEETHALTHWVPEQLYVLEAVSNTSAPYGDKFSVYFKYIIRPDGSAPAAASVLHLLFCVDFQPSMNRMMKPVIAKAVDSGVRGTFRIFRSVLGGLRPGTADMAEAELPPGGLLAGALASYSSSSASESEGEEEEGEEGEGGEEGARKHRHHHVHHHAFVPAATLPAQAAGPTPGAHPGMVGAPGLLSVFSQQLVYKDQVVLLADLVGAGLRSVTHSELGAQGLAALLTVWLISLAVAALRSWQQLCAAAAPGGAGEGKGGAAAAAGGGGGGGGGWLLPVCWPLQVVDVPDSTMEVITSLALVAAINWALIRGSEAAVRYLASTHPALLASVRANAAAAAAAAAAGGSAGAGVGGGAGGAGGASGGVGVVGGLPLGAPPPEAAAAAAAPIAAPGASKRASGGGASGGGAGPAAAAAAGAGAAAAAAAAPSSAVLASPGKGKDKEKGKGKDKAEKEAKGKKGGSGGGAAAAAKPAHMPAPVVMAAVQSKPMRAAPAPKQFTPEQLRMLEMGAVSSGGSAAAAATAAAAAGSRGASRADAPTSAAAAPTSSATNPSLISMPDAWATDLPAGMVLPTSPDRPPPPSAASLPPSSAALASPPARSASPPPPATMSRVATSVDGRSGAGFGVAAPPPRSFTTVRPGDGAGSLASAPASSASMGGGGPTPTPSPAGRAPPPSAAPPPSVVAAAAAAAAAAQASGALGTSNASSFANMFTKEGIDSMAESFRSAFRWDLKPSDEHAGEPTSPSAAAAAAAAAAGGAPPTGKPNGASGAAAAARAAAVAASFRSSPAVRSATAGGGHLAAMSEPIASMYSARSDFLQAPSGDFDGAAAAGGGGLAAASEPAVVVEEVFENERFQPFRGWGHMWPGHFLPSDRVGHWSDRQGKPGGTASMVWEQVVPLLPVGWRWVEDEWQIDLDGTEVEAVDGDGWSYALDFYLLKYPPPPQAGKCSLKHFVRRRRLFRTRVRLPDRSLLDSGSESGLMGLPLLPLSPDAAAGAGTPAELSALALDPDAPHAAAPLPVSTSAASAPGSTHGGGRKGEVGEPGQGAGERDSLATTSVLSLAEALPSRSLDSHGHSAAHGGLGGLGGSAPQASSSETLAASGGGGSTVDFRPASLPAISGGAAGGGGGGWLASPGGMGPSLPRPRSTTTLAGAGGGAEQPHSSSGSGTAKHAVAMAEVVSGEARAPAEAAALWDLLASETPSQPPQQPYTAAGRRRSSASGGGGGPGKVSAGVSPSPSPPKRHAGAAGGAVAAAAAATGVARAGQHPHPHPPAAGGGRHVEVPPPAAAPVAAVAVARAAPGYAASAAEPDAGPAARVSTEGYVLSPKTEVKAHDPLGALLQDEVAALAAPAKPASAKPVDVPVEAAGAAAGSGGSPSGARQGAGAAAGSGGSVSRKAGGKLGAVPLRRGGSDAAGASAATRGSDSGEAALKGAASLGQPEHGTVAGAEAEVGGAPARADSGAGGAGGGSGGKQQARAARRAAAAHSRGTGAGAGGSGSGAGEAEGDLGGGAVVAADLVD